MTCRPASSSILVIVPVRLRLVASGLIMEKVRSIAIGSSLFWEWKLEWRALYKPPGGLPRGGRFWSRRAVCGIIRRLRARFGSMSEASRRTGSDELALPQTRRCRRHSLDDRRSRLACPHAAVLSSARGEFRFRPGMAMRPHGAGRSDLRQAGRQGRAEQGRAKLDAKARPPLSVSACPRPSAPHAAAPKL